MNIIAWNCRGLGNVNAVPCIKDLVRVYKQNVIILIETLCNNNKICSLKYFISFDQHFSVDCIGRSSSIAIRWHNSANCSITNYSKKFIDLSIQELVKGKLHLTAFYGFCEQG
jgi:hypothetical protein